MGLPLFLPRRSLSDASPSIRPAKVVGGGAVKFARGREVAALLLWASAIYLVLALASFKGDPHAVADAPAASVVVGADWVGVVGAFCARALVSTVGLVAWVLPLELALLGVPFVRGKRSNLTPIRLGGDVLIALLAASLVQVGWPGWQVFGKYSAAGMTGELFGELLRSLFSTAGSFLIGFTLLGLILIARATFSFIALMRLIARFSVKSAERTAKVSRGVAVAWREARELERARKEKERVRALPRIFDSPTETRAIFVGSTDGDSAKVPSVHDDEERSALSPPPKPSMWASDLTPSFFSATPAPLEARAKKLVATRHEARLNVAKASRRALSPANRSLMCWHGRAGAKRLRCPMRIRSPAQNFFPRVGNDNRVMFG